MGWEEGGEDVGGSSVEKRGKEQGKGGWGRQAAAPLALQRLSRAVTLINR